MDISLSDDERSALQDVLDAALGDLSMEIADTDNAQYRRELESRRANLQGVAKKLQA